MSTSSLFSVLGLVEVKPKQKKALFTPYVCQINVLYKSFVLKRLTNLITTFIIYDKGLLAIYSSSRGV